MSSLPQRAISQLTSRLASFYHYRSLLYFMVLREVKVRYKNSVLGFLWSLLNPLAMMMVFTVIFGILMPNSEIDKYPIFLLCGLLPWNYFSAGISGSINSISGGANLVKKVFFPREILPIATILAQLVNFLLALIVLFVLLIVFESRISSWIWLLPVVIAIQTCLMCGIGLILSTLNVFYRDVAMIMDVVILAWFFVTPIFYSVDKLPNERLFTILGTHFDVHRLFYILNPMASITRMYRDLLYWGHRTDVDFFLRSSVTSIVVLLIGYWFFVKYSGRFGEEV